MKPPICEVCDERFDPADGDLIRFVDTPASKAFDERMEEPGFVGHSPSSGWFCSIHVDDARSRADSMTLADALRSMAAPEHAPAFADAVTSLVAEVPTPAADPFSLSPDLEGVDLRGGTIRRRMNEGESSIEWTLRPVALQTARQHFLELVPRLFERLGLGAAPDLMVTTKRDWNPMDGAVAPNCPYVDHVRHEPAAEGPPAVSVSSDAAHWSDTDISNVSTHLFINVDGVRVSTFASGRGDHDACTTLSLFRPTAPEVVDALTAAFTPWLD